MVKSQGGMVPRYGGNAPPTPLQNAYTNYGVTAQKQASDYDDIMGKYKSTYDSIPTGGSSGNAALNFQYTKPTYQTTADYTRSVGNLRDTSDKGLYSDEDQANLRERGVSPIRSVYANAQRNVNRQRALQGGYSPNYAAVSAKMAREMSSQLSDQTTKVNAQIAQDIAAQRAAAQGAYASTASGEQNARNNFELSAADSANKYGLNKLDAEMKDYWAPTQAKLSALGGATSLFGTQPGFTTTMQTGAQNQAAQESNTAQNNANTQTKLMQLFGGMH